MFRVLLTAFLCALAAPALASDEPVSTRNGVSGDWALFSEDGLCWTVTAQRYSGKQIFLSVTVFEGKGAPQVSVMAADRLPVSAGLGLNVGAKTYRMTSDGRSAWPPKSADPQIIAQLAANHEATLVQPGNPSIRFSPKGFARAYNKTLERCGQSGGASGAGATS